MPRTKKKPAEVKLSIHERVAMLNEKYGAGTAIVASDIPLKHVVFMSTGSRALDFALGGGFPKNRITEIRGQFSSLKSTLCLQTIANLQMVNKTAVGIYLDVEKTFNANYAEKLGVDNSRLVVLTPDSGEQGVDLVKDVCNWDVEILTVIDSIAALVPTKEIEDDTEKQNMGLQARLINKLMRVITARMKKSMYSPDVPATSILAINQLRQKIGVMFGDPETTPGGVGKDFFYSVILRLKSTPSMAVKEKMKVGKVEHERIVAQNVGYKILKNKCCGTQYEEGEFTFHRRKVGEHPALSFDNIEPLFRYGLVYDVIKFENDCYTVDLDSGDTVSYKRDGDFKNALLHADQDDLNDLYLRILEKIADIEGNSEVIEQEDDPEFENETEEEYEPEPKKRRAKIKRAIKRKS